MQAARSWTIDREYGFMNLRSVSDGWIFSQGGAEGGDLLGHLFELSIPEMRLCRVEDAVECLRSVKGKDLQKTQKVKVSSFPQ